MADEAGRGVRERAVVPHEHDDLTLDPDVIRRSYRAHRARRAARVERHRRSRRAGLRFWGVLVALAVTCGVLVVTTWREIGRLFGL